MTRTHHTPVTTLRCNLSLIMLSLCAVQVVGDLQLAEKFQRSVALLRRDIMFAASLYI